MIPEILVVEDNEEWRDILKDEIEFLGYKVDVAASFEEAIKCLSNKVYSVVITDIGLSEIPEDTSGIDILIWIKQRRLPTVTLAISGRATFGFKKEEFKERYGAFAYIDRNFYESEDLAELVSKAVRLSQQMMDKIKSAQTM